MSKHTPPPWRAVLPGFNKHLWCRFIEDKDGNLIARINYANPVQSENEAIANADFIALAVNNHAALMAALQKMMICFCGPDSKMNRWSVSKHQAYREASDIYYKIDRGEA